MLKPKYLKTDDLKLFLGNMSAYRFFGNYTVGSLLSALMSANTFGITLDVDELYNYAGILPAFDRQAKIGYLYLIQSYYRGFPCLKIGKTIDLRRRMYEYEIRGELQTLVGAFLVFNMNLGELFLIRTFDSILQAPYDFMNRRIGREYYLWNDSVQAYMLETISRMIQTVAES